MTAGCVGAAAGCLGTWFEMSHAVVCVPVVTLPPLGLSHHVAVGSTVFGVAVRQALASTLYALEPGTSLTLDDLSEIVDLNAVAVLGSSSTVAALGSAAFSVRLAQRTLRKANGAFVVALALFVHWRNRKINAAMEEREEAAAAAAEAAREMVGDQIVPMVPVAEPLAQLDPEVPKTAWPLPENRSARLLMLGCASGTCLGLFGIGPAWMLAPILTHTAPAGQQVVAGPERGQVLPPSNIGPEPQGADLEYDPGLSASDQRIRSTACFAMVPASIAVAFRHWQLGHIPHAGTVAIPLAAGACFGSYCGGTLLVDVPCEPSFRAALAYLLFAHGCWTFFKP